MIRNIRDGNERNAFNVKGAFKIPAWKEGSVFFPYTTLPLYF